MLGESDCKSNRERIAETQTARWHGPLSIDRLSRAEAEALDIDLAARIPPSAQVFDIQALSVNEAVRPARIYDRQRKGAGPVCDRCRVNLAVNRVNLVNLVNLTFLPLQLALWRGANYPRPIQVVEGPVCNGMLSLLLALSS